MSGHGAGARASVPRGVGRGRRRDGRLPARRTAAMIGLAALVALAAAAAQPSRAAERALSFGFLDDPPGTLVSIGATRLHLHCRGTAAGEATVLFDSGLGGNALEWSPVADALAPRARVCTYDRAGYGWSDPSPGRRDARRLAGELALLLEAADVSGPFVLVAHSFGGLVARLFVEGRSDVAGLVLVDSSHEDQFTRLETPGARPMMPRNRQFVISQNEPPESLPEEVRRKVAAFGRMRKTYSATHGEMAAFRDSAEQVHAARARRPTPYALPVTVIRRGRDVYAGRVSGKEKTAAWVELQEDLATLGTPGRLVVAEGSGHHVHADDPALVVAEIERLLDGDAARGAGAPSAGPDAPATRDADAEAGTDAGTPLGGDGRP